MCSVTVYGCSVNWVTSARYQGVYIPEEFFIRHEAIGFSRILDILSSAHRMRRVLDSEFTNAAKRS